MQQENRIVQLIRKYRDNSLTSKEQQELQVWIEADQANRQLFERLTVNDHLFEELSKIYKVDKEAGWQKIQSRLSAKDEKKDPHDLPPH